MSSNVTIRNNQFSNHTIGSANISPGATNVQYGDNGPQIDPTAKQRRHLP
jgi:hypothetical protein